MVHDTITQAVGKRVVGKQNLIPLVRDAAEDDREMVVVIDTDRQRYKGNPVGVGRGSSNNPVIILAGEFKARDNSTRSRITVAESRMLAVQIESVLGKTTPTDIYAEMHMSEKGGSEHPEETSDAKN